MHPFPLSIQNVSCWGPFPGLCRDESWSASGSIWISVISLPVVDTADPESRSLQEPLPSGVFSAPWCLILLATLWLVPDCSPLRGMAGYSPNGMFQEVLAPSFPQLTRISICSDAVWKMSRMSLMLFMAMPALHTVEPLLKDHPIRHTKCGLSRQVVFADRFSYIEM